MRNKWKKKSLYIASFLKDEYDDEGNIISTYAKPKFIGKENIQPLSGTSDIETYGTKVSKMQKVLLDTSFRVLNPTVAEINSMTVKEVHEMTVQSLQGKYSKKQFVIKENDLVYLDGITPAGEQVYGENANYRVDSVRVQNKKIAIYFEKLPNK